MSEEVTPVAIVAKTDELSTEKTQPPVKKKRHQFLPGNQAAKGRKATQTIYRELLVKTVKKSDWKEIIDKCVEQAKTGDKDARKFLGDFVVGRPELKIAAEITQLSMEQITQRIDIMFGLAEEGDAPTE